MHRCAELAPLWKDRADSDPKQHNDYNGKLLMHEEGILIAVAIENLHDENFEAE